MDYARGDTVEYVGARYSEFVAKPGKTGQMGEVLRQDENGVMVDFTFSSYFRADELKLIQRKAEVESDFLKHIASLRLGAIKRYQPWATVDITRLEGIVASL